MGTLLLVIAALLPAQTAAWATHTNPEGRFSVSLPAQPQISTEPLEVRGGSFPQTTAQVVAPGAVYMVVWADPPITDSVEDRRSFIDNARDSLVKTVNGTLLTSVPWEFGQQGIEFTVGMGAAASERLVRVRMSFVGVRAYTLLSMYPSNAVRAADDRRFFDSFKLISQ